MDWFLYDNGVRHERVTQIGIFCDQQLFSEEQINQSFLVIHIDLRQKKKPKILFLVVVRALSFLDLSMVTGGGFRLTDRFNDRLL